MTRRSLYEVILVTVVVALTCLLAIGIYRGRVRVESGQRLVQELAMLRQSIATSRAIQQAFPERLEDITPSLDVFPRNERGQLIDPFGSPYHYDPKTGWVSSTTPSYEHW